MSLGLNGLTVLGMVCWKYILDVAYSNHYLVLWYYYHMFMYLSVLHWCAGYSFSLTQHSLYANGVIYCGHNVVVSVHWHIVQSDYNHYAELLNSSPSCASYMRQWIGSVLVQMMACRQFSAKPLSKAMLEYCYLDHQGQKIQWNCNRNVNIFILENAFGNGVCEMASIFSWPQCVNSISYVW